MQRVATVLLALATATAVVGCGGHDDRDRAQAAPDSGHANTLTRAHGLPEGHPPIDPHHPWMLLPEGHPPIHEGGLACPRRSLTPGASPGLGGGALQDVPAVISI